MLLARGAVPNALEKTGERPTPLDHAIQVIICLTDNAI